MPPPNGKNTARSKVHFLGPIVWTTASTDAKGVRRAEMESGDPNALPPEMTEDQQDRLCDGLVGSLAHDFVLPELERRFGMRISAWDFLFAPEWQSRIRQILIIVPQSGPPSVLFNEEVAGVDVPEGSGHATLARERYKWDVHLNWTPLFPDQIQAKVVGVVRDLATAIMNGDETAAAQMARLWFPEIWNDSPNSLRTEHLKEIYVLMYPLWDRNLGTLEAGSDPLRIVYRTFPEAVAALEREYDWESIKADVEGFPEDIRRKVERFVSDIEGLFDRANFSCQQLRVLRLEAVLALRDEKWSGADKEEFMGIRRGSYAQALYEARLKLAQASNRRNDPYRRFVEAILRQDE